MTRLSFRKLCILSILIVFAGVALSPFISNIIYRSEITEYFRDDDPRVIAFHALESSLGFQQSLLVLLELDQVSFLDSQQILTLFNAEEAIRALPGITRVQSLLSNAVSADDLETRSAISLLRKGEALTDPALGQLADIAHRNGGMLSQDQRIAAVQVSFASPDAIDANYPAIRAILDGRVQQKQLQQYFLLGPVEIKHALHEALMHDGVYLMPLVLLAGLGLLWYFLRSWWLVFSGAVSIIAALWITAGFVGLLGLTINQTSGLAFCITFIIALADIIHLLLSYSHQPRTQSNVAAMMNSMRGNGMSLFLTSLTTSIGFFSLNWSSSPVFATFGNIATIGVVCAFLTAVTITPVVAVLVAPTNSGREPDVFLRLVRRTFAFARSLDHRRAFVLYGLSTLLAAGMLLNDYHNDPLDYFEEKSPITQATHISEQDFGVHHPISVYIDSGRDDGVFSQSFINAVVNFQAWLDSRSAVSRQSSYLDTLQNLNLHLHEYDARWGAPLTQEHVVADTWNLYQMSSPDTAPQSLGIDAGFRAASVSVGLQRLRSQQLLDLEQEILAWFNVNAPELNVSVTGHALLFAGIGKDLTQNMFVGGLLSAMVISLLLGLFLGNMKIGLISMIPNLFPAAVVFGIWGAGKGIIDIAAAGTLSISLGIVVDDTIHILKRYIDYRKSGYSPQHSLHLTFEHVGSALVLTTVVLTLGMSILTFSIFGPNKTTAQLMSCTIFVALFYDLVMLPHLLKVLDRWLFAGVPIHRPELAFTGP